MAGMPVARHGLVVGEQRGAEEVVVGVVGVVDVVVAAAETEAGAEAEAEAEAVAVEAGGECYLSVVSVI